MRECRAEQRELERGAYHLDGPRMTRLRRSPATSATQAGKLTPKEAALVQAILDVAAEGKPFPTRAELGTQAGYGVGDVARVQASRALARQHVRDAIARGIRETAGVDVGLAYSALRLAAAKAGSARDRIAASREILNLAGLTGADSYGGAPVTVQIVFRTPEAAAVLQAAPAPHTAPVIEATPHMSED